MKTQELTPAQMQTRIARFADLKALPIQTGSAVPLEALDLIYARKIMPIVALADGTVTALSEQAPIRDAGGMTISFAICPPGQGPSLHTHQQTFETFTVLKGRFEFAYGHEGRDRVVLSLFDTISIPPLVSRAFRNVGAEEGMLQVIITGGVHDMNDLAVQHSVADRLREISPDFLEDITERKGLSFELGKE